MKSIITVCSRSLDPFHMISYYINSVGTSWTDSMISFPYLPNNAWEREAELKVVHSSIKCRQKFLSILLMEKYGFSTFFYIFFIHVERYDDNDKWEQRFYCRVGLEADSQ